MSPVSVQSTINTNIPCKRKHVEEDTTSSTGDNDNLLSSMSLPDLLLLLTNSVTPTVPIPQDAASSSDTTTISSSSPITITNDVIGEEPSSSLSCFDQETAPPSSILPPMLGDDWFLLDNALPPVHHEAPESPSCSSASSFSAPSSSPSITPVQQPMDMFATATSTTTEHQQQESNEFTVMIMTGRVAQKSYGTEKRFLCPPPTTVVLGPSLPLHTIRIQADGGPQQSGTLEPAAEGYLQCISRHLHITEKRKQISVAVDVPHLGKFTSNPIKVISKPSKKRQSSMKHLELCVHHGSTIALFNRIRSQTVSTKYLGVDPSTTNQLDFVARQSAWDPFLIWAVDGDKGGGGKKGHGALHYNQRVVLQCVKTGMMTPVMVIRRRKNDIKEQQHDDPVSQLHRIALEVADQPSHYLACINDKVITNAHMEATDDQAIWTIIGTDCTTYRFRTTPSSLPSEVVTPFPQVQSIEQNDNDNTITLHGQHLGPHLQVALADCIILQQISPATPNEIKCRLPSSSSLDTMASLVVQEEQDGMKKWPIALIRQADGTLYRTSHFCTL